MSRFEMLVEEYMKKLKRDLSIKEIAWIQWVVDREKQENEWNK